MREAFVLAKHAPGIGNPLDLPIDEFNEFLIVLTDYFNAQQSDTENIDHRAYVEQQMRNLHNG